MKVAWQTAINDSYKTDVEGVATSGVPRWTRTIGDKVYRWVKNASGATRVKGELAFYGTSDLTVGEVYTCNQSTKGTALSTFVGVWTSDSVPAGEFGWIQVSGYNDSVSVLGNASLGVGDYLIGTADQTYASYAGEVGATNNQTGVVGVMLENYTTTSAALKKVYIRGLR